MKNLSEQLIHDLISKGVDTFFGIQGGACARLIENVVKFKGKFVPVLNEQSAGYYAHGYYMATGKTAGLIFTTGPGLTNGISGIAACYYDRVPLIVLVGQVPTRLNISKKTKTRMVGFQEVPHLDICKPISDNIFKIDTAQKYLKSRVEILNDISSKVQTLEILDDVQRINLKNKIKNYKINKIKETKKSLNKNILKLINNSVKKTVLVGAGFCNHQNYYHMIKKLKKLNYEFASTWGGQKVQKNFSIKDKFLGLFGNHNPGLANSKIKNSDLIISIGCSLLQHQVGKNYDEFAPNAKIIYVNNDNNECNRAKLQFGKRLIAVNDTAKNFINNCPKNKKFSNDLIYNSKPNVYPVEFLKNFIKETNKNSLIFSDAGATLSWTYQAANNVVKCPQIFTSFNLHSMGYANCAAIGASINKNNIFCIIGDGSLPMNSQELSWLKKFKVKLIILDNKGYGIIRQTQRQFYNSNFIASDFKNKKSSMPDYKVNSILKSFNIPFKNVKNKSYKSEISWLIKNKQSSALLVNIDYKYQVET